MYEIRLGCSSLQRFKLFLIFFHADKLMRKIQKQVIYRRHLGAETKQVSTELLEGGAQRANKIFSKLFKLHIFTIKVANLQYDDFSLRNILHILLLKSISFCVQSQQSATQTKSILRPKRLRTNTTFTIVAKLWLRSETIFLYLSTLSGKI